MVPYTYIIKCIPTGEFYYGVKYGKDADPSTFWVKYFTSSKKVAARIVEFGINSFKVQIRKTFSCPKKARRWEATVIRRLKLVERPNFLNASNGIDFNTRSTMKGMKSYFNPITQKYSWFNKDVLVPAPWVLQGIPKPDSFKVKISNFQKSYVRSEEHQIKLTTNATAAAKKRKGKSYKDLYGAERATEKIKAMSNTAKGKPSPHKGKTYSEICTLANVDELIAKRSQAISGDNNPGKKMKGKSYEELYGKEKAEQLKILRSKRRNTY